MGPTDKSFRFLKNSGKVQGPGFPQACIGGIVGTAICPGATFDGFTNIGFINSNNHGLVGGIVGDFGGGTLKNSANAGAFNKA